MNMSPFTGSTGLEVLWSVSQEGSTESARCYVLIGIDLMPMSKVKRQKALWHILFTQVIDFPPPLPWCIAFCDLINWCLCLRTCTIPSQDFKLTLVSSSVQVNSEHRKPEKRMIAESKWEEGNRENSHQSRSRNVVKPWMQYFLRTLQVRHLRSAIFTVDVASSSQVWTSHLHSADCRDSCHRVLQNPAFKKRSAQFKHINWKTSFHAGGRILN